MTNLQSQVVNNPTSRNALLEHLLEQLYEGPTVNPRVLEWLLALLHGILPGTVVEASVEARSNTVTVAVIDQDNRKARNVCVALHAFLTLFLAGVFQGSADNTAQQNHSCVCAR